MPYDTCGELRGMGQDCMFVLMFPSSAEFHQRSILTYHRHYTRTTAVTDTPVQYHIPSDNKQVPSYQHTESFPKARISQSTNTVNVFLRHTNSYDPPSTRITIQRFITAFTKACHYSQTHQCTFTANSTLSLQLVSKLVSTLVRSTTLY